MSGVEHAAVPTGLTGIADGLFLWVDMLRGKGKGSLDLNQQSPDSLNKIRPNSIHSPGAILNIKIR